MRDMSQSGVSVRRKKRVHVNRNMFCLLTGPGAVDTSVESVNTTIVIKENFLSVLH